MSPTPLATAPSSTRSAANPRDLEANGRDHVLLPPPTTTFLAPHNTATHPTKEMEHDGQQRPARLRPRPRADSTNLDHRGTDLGAPRPRRRVPTSRHRDTPAPAHPLRGTPLRLGRRVHSVGRPRHGRAPPG